MAHAVDADLWRLSLGWFVDAQDSPAAAAPFQRVVAPVVLRDRVRITQPGIERSQHLAVHSVVADRDDGTAKVAPGDAGQPLTARSRTSGRGSTPGARSTEPHRSVTASRLMPVHGP
jgi:hypothetical protein